MATKDSTKQEGGAPPEDAPKTGMKAKLPMIAMIAVGLAVGGGTGAVVLGPMMAKKMGRTAAPAAAAPSETAEAEAPAEPGGHGSPGEAAVGGETKVFLLENLVLNPAGSGGNRFLLLTVAIETASATVITNLQARDAELRDIVLSALANKTVEQLTEIVNRDGIKAELLAAITARFGKDSVKRLYFPQFVVQ